MNSFTSAGAFPIKLIKNEKFIESLNKGKFIPIHIQLNPTNKCNLNCSFCSCKDREKGIELEWRRMVSCLIQFSHLGTQAVTITGGGEPLLYSHIDELINLCVGLRFKIGLVTNGTQFKKTELLNYFTWIRISCSDERMHEFHKLKNIVKKYPLPDWSFSYVLSEKPDIYNLVKVIEFANEHNFTHIRIVSDILKDSKISEVMKKTKEKLSSLVNLDKVIFQDRGKYTKGAHNCFLSLIKPVIGADGNIYPCCGIQYAFPNTKKDYNHKMGSIEEIKQIWDNSRWFYGGNCQKCYYNYYNDLVDQLTFDHKHMEFI